MQFLFKEKISRPTCRAAQQIGHPKTLSHVNGRRTRHLVACGIHHSANDRQPHNIFWKVASATAEVRIHPAKIVAVRDGFNCTLTRERYCASDFVPRRGAVQPDWDFNVYRLHERGSAAGIELLLVMQHKPYKGHVRRIRIACLFPYDHIPNSSAHFTPAIYAGQYHPGLPSRILLPCSFRSPKRGKYQSGGLMDRGIG
jgi:hypothetical protein